MPRNALSERVERLEMTVNQLTTLPMDVRNMGKRLDGMGERLDGMGKRLDGMGERLDGMDRRLDGMDGRLSSVEGRLGSVEVRLGSVEVQIVQLRGEMRDGFAALKTELSAQIDANWQRTRALFEEVIDRIKTIGER